MPLTSSNMLLTFSYNYVHILKHVNTFKDVDIHTCSQSQTCFRTPVCVFGILLMLLTSSDIPTFSKYFSQPQTCCLYLQTCFSHPQTRCLYFQTCFSHPQKGCSPSPTCVQVDPGPAVHLPQRVFRLIPDLLFTFPNVCSG